MGEASLRIFRHIKLFSRFSFKYKLSNQFYSVRNLPIKTFSPEILIDVKRSETLWNRNKDISKNYTLIKHLHECFMRNDEIINYAVDMISSACSRSACSHNFTFTLIKTLDDYIKENEIDFSPTLNQKNEALFSVLRYKDYHLIQLVCKVFKISHQTVAFKSVIESMIQQEKLVEAALCAAALHLQKEFEVEKILLPLLLREKLHIAITYMVDHPDLQLRAAKFLDKFLDKEISTPQLNSKKVFKMLTSIVNLYKIPLIHCPNLHFIRSKGAINTLVNRHIEHSVSEEVWEDMIKSVVGDNSFLQKFLIKKLLKKNDLKSAQKMATLYNIDEPTLFESISETNIIDSQMDLEDVQSEDLAISFNEIVVGNDDKPVDHLEFALKAEDIIMISDQNNFVKCVDEIAQNYTMIGIDSEWKPNFGLSSDRLSLIQLAGHDKVFIFDVLLLTHCLDAQHWDKLFDSIFGNPNIIKLGCGIEADVNMILNCIKGSSGKTVKFSHMLDIALFYQKLLEVYPDKLEMGENDGTLKGLSFLCNTILGKPLNKEERLCNWEQRPLKESQVQYAALDAHCLLQIYNKLKEYSLKEGINFDNLSKVAIVLTNNLWKPKRRFKGIKSDKAFQIHDVIPIEHFKAVVDPVFESQGKELRKLGADVFILGDIDTAAESAIKLFKTEKRTIICSDFLWNQVKGKIPEGYVHNFKSASENPITVSNFLQYFNIQVTTKKIFSRCIICNSSSGIKVNYEDLKKLVELVEGNATGRNLLISKNLNIFSPDLQAVLLNLLSSDTDIKFTSSVPSVKLSECAFLCKTCGSIC